MLQRLATDGWNISVYRSVYPPVSSNMYIIIADKEAIVVDSNISGGVYELLSERGVQKVHLFLSHEHYDHSYGVCWFQKHFDTTLYAHSQCRNMLSTDKASSPRLVAFILSAMDMNDGGHRYEDFKNEMTQYSLSPDIFFEDKEKYDVAGHSIEIIHTPGHTPGSCLFIMDGQFLFSGDTIIMGNKVITGFKGGNKEEFMNVTLPKLKALPTELTVLPGHGDPFKIKDYNFDIYNV